MLKEFRTQRIIWDKANKRIFDPIQTSGGDQNGRRLEVQILNNGEVEDLTGTDLYLAWQTRNKTHSGLEPFDALDASEGIFELYYPTGMLAHAGALRGGLALVDSDGRLVSREFIIQVDRNIVDDEVAESSNEFTALTEALVKINDLEANYAPRLNEVTAQLAQKANEAEVRKNNVPIGLNDASPELLQALSESPGVPFNVLSIPRRGSVSVEKTDFVKPKKNLFNGEYVAAIINGDSNSGAVFNSNSTGRSVIVPVKPFTTYSVLTGNSNRFRIALNDSYPTFGQTLKRYEKDANVGDSAFPQRGIFRTYTFTTQENENYMVVYLSADLAEQPLVQVEEANESSQYEPYSLSINHDISMDKEFLSENIVRSKNVFDGNYIDGILVGNIGQSSEFRLGGGKIAVLPIKVGESYSISKTISSRFRVAVSKQYPSATIPVEFLFNSDDKSKTTVTIPNDYSFLLVYVSNDSKEPAFMQVEKGSNVTDWESYGYRFSKPSKKFPVGTTPEDYGAKGDGVTDDTAALQRLFDSGTQIVDFPRGKQYLVSTNINVRADKPIHILGRNSKLIANGDIQILNIVGNQTGSADPGVSANVARNEKGMIVDGLRFGSLVDDQATAINVTGTFGLTIKNCNMSFMRRGIAINGINRNMIIESNHIYAMYLYGIHFTFNGDIHQINIFGNHVSYCRINLFAEDQGIYNMQITGNDFETSLYPTVPSDRTKHNMCFQSHVRMMEDIEIVGNTLEDHWYSDELIKFDGFSYESIMEVTLTGNVIGNARGDVLSVKGISRSSFVGNTLKKYRGYALRIKGDLESFIFEGNSASPESGGLIKCEGDFYFKQVSLSNNVMGLTPTTNAIDISVRSIQGTRICGNAVTLNSLDDYDDTKALVNIVATSSIRRSIFKDNLLTSYNNPVAISMRVKAPTVSKVTVKNNMAGGISEQNTFDLPAASATVFVSENA